MLKFQKMNGAGNDFVMLDNRQNDLRLTSGQIARLCDRHRGVGADGVLLVEPAQSGANFRMRYYNADGGEAEMCGNGARCFARFAQKVANAGSQLNFETQAGIIQAEITGDLVTLQMSEPKDLKLNREVILSEGSIKPGTALTVHSLNTGVPHVVVFVDHLDKVDVANLGAELRWHEAFAPKGTNVNFARQLSSHVIAIRTYERGVEAETLACGTGVVATALIHALVTNVDGPVAVEVRGGETLKVGFRKVGDHHFTDVTLTGPADFAFSGEIDLD
ncbi:MAG TPA: diaminopimelate epimerase [Chthoniobacterales bacterium]